MPGARRRRFPLSPRVLRWALCMAGGIGLAGFISGAAWLALSDGPLRAPEAVEVLIPAGTAEAVEAGSPPPSIPRDLRFVEGDTLVLRNEDSVAHRVGGYSVAAGSTLEVPLDQATSASLFCSFHPQGTIGLDVRARTSPLMVLWPTLIIGVPLGLIAGVVVEVTRRLDGRAQG